MRRRPPGACSPPDVNQEWIFAGFLAYAEVHAVRISKPLAVQPSPGTPDASYRFGLSQKGGIGRRGGALDRRRPHRVRSPQSVGSSPWLERVPRRGALADHAFIFGSERPCRIS